MTRSTHRPAHKSAKKTVGLIQISEQVGHGYYFPYTAGCLQAYVQQAAPDCFQFLPIIYQRLKVSEALSRLDGVIVAAFSVYIWNIERSLAIAAALKAKDPEVCIFFGGPQIPDQAETFLRQHPFIDACCHGAGEETFLKLLERSPDRDWSDLAGISYLETCDTTAVFKTSQPAPRGAIEDLPSPYLSGVFDSLLGQESWKGVWETNRGCPFACTFCDWGSATGAKVLRFPQARIKAEAEWFGRQRIQQIYVTDANFGLLPRDLELAQKMAESAQRWGYPKTLMTQTAKNSPERVIAIHQILAEAGLQTLAAISLQSLSEPVLKAIKRENISLQAFAKIQQACHRLGIQTYTDLIMGLPGESLASFATGIEAVLDSGQWHFIQFFDAAVLPNAELAHPDYIQKHAIETVEIPFPSHPTHIDGIQEKLPIVIATAEMPRKDNIEAHILAWSTLFWVHKHKLLQIVLLLLRSISGKPWLFWITALMRTDPRQYPLLAETTAFFKRTAQALHQGSILSQLQSDRMQLKPGVLVSPELSIQIRWLAEGRINQVYQEAFLCLSAIIQQHNITLDLRVLDQACQLNRALFLELLNQDSLPIPGLSSYPIYLDYDLPGFYQNMRSSQRARLERKPATLISHTLPRIFGSEHAEKIS